MVFYGAKYLQYRTSLSKEKEARQLFEIGSDIRDVRTTLQEHGFTVSEIENHRGVGTNVLLVTLTELEEMGSFRNATGVNLTPYSYEPKHWLVIKTKPGTKQVISAF